MSVITKIKYKCPHCAEEHEASAFELETEDDGACGDPECCGYAYEYAILRLTCDGCGKSSTFRDYNL